MKPILSLPILALSGAILSGCGSKAPDAATTQPTSQSTSTPKAAPALDDSLHNDAYAYYGLGSTTPKKYDLILNRPTPSTSEQTITIARDSDAKGKATYTETAEGVMGPGGPKSSNTQTMTLEPDGLYVESISPQTLKTPHFLQLPAKLDPGTTWKNRQSIEATGQTVDEDLTFKVIGVEPVKTAAGTVQALHIVGNGPGKINGKSATFKVEMWYQKDFGMVKQSASITSGGVDTTIVQTLKK